MEGYQEMENPQKQETIRDEKGRFIPGVSGNPGGRPLGSISLTEAIRRRLDTLGPDQKRKVIEYLADNITQDALEGGKYGTKMRQLIWNYLEGMPQQKAELTHIIPKPLDDVSKDDSLQEDKSSKEENKGGTGGDSSFKDGFDNTVSDS